ncbi:MAG: lysophospholipid acyltransferase family protein [Cyanobacteriota bacterium]
MDFVSLKVKYLPPYIYRIFWSFDQSVRVEKINEPDLNDAPKIFATWHGRQYCFLRLDPREKLNILISKSNDGEIVTRVMQRLGFSVIRGSASRGGMSAARQMLEVLNNGGNIAFTVDGPRGPIYEVKTGIIKLAQMSSAPIIPVIPATNMRLIISNSWDKYNLPLWFSDIKYFFGTPFYVDKDLSDDNIEEARKKLNNEMNKLTYLADKEVDSLKY